MYYLRSSDLKLIPTSEVGGKGVLGLFWVMISIRLQCKFNSVSRVRRRPVAGSCGPQSRGGVCPRTGHRCITGPTQRETQPLRTTIMPRGILETPMWKTSRVFRVHTDSKGEHFKLYIKTPRVFCATLVLTLKHLRESLASLPVCRKHKLFSY